MEDDSSRPSCSHGPDRSYKSEYKDLYYLERKRRKQEEISKQLGDTSDKSKVCNIEAVCHPEGTPVTEEICVSSVELSQDVAQGISSKKPSVSRSFIIEDIDNYLLLISQSQTLISLTPHDYAIEEYSLKRKQLERNKFQLVRYGKNAYSCSCSPTSSQLRVAGLEVGKDLCIHTQIVHRRFSKVFLQEEAVQTKDDHSYSLPAQIFKIPTYDGGVLVYTPSAGKPVGCVNVKYEFVGQRRPYLYCFSCQSRNCIHVNIVENERSSHEELDVLDLILELGINDSLRMKKATTNSLYEQRPPFVYLGLTEDFRTDFKPNSCTQCGICDIKTEEDFKTIVIYSDRIVSATVWKETCKCGSREYDGRDDLVLHMGTYAVSFVLLYRYLHSFATACMPMHTFYKVYMSETIMRQGYDAPSRFRYSMFVSAVKCFFSSLDIDEKSFFLCPWCGTFPDKLVFDGQCVSFRRCFFDFNKDQLEDQAPIGKSRTCTKSFLKSKESRQMLSKYCHESLYEEEHKQMIAGILLERPSLAEFLKVNPECPQYAKELIGNLACHSPVISFLLPEDDLLVALKAACDNTANSSQLHLISKWCSPIFNCIHDGTMDPQMSLVVRDLMASAEDTFKSEVLESLPPTAEPTLSFYPNFPLVRRRGLYPGDSENIKTVGCVKVTGRHPTLLPGVFTAMCIHGVTYGYEVMHQAESPNTLFTLLRTRFPKAPRWIIYDNACNAQRYALNRTPCAFKDSRFVVDRLHWKNHKCSTGFNMENYEELKNLNSQVVEQRHARSVKLKSMLSYTNASTFMLFMKVFQIFQNGVTLGSNSLHFPEFFQASKMLAANR